MASSKFYDAGPLKQIAINLFYGWGYNFYKQENQLRADDQLVRSKVGWLLGVVHKSLQAAESTYRREFLPPPSREKPRPEPSAVAGAQTLERLSKAVSTLAGQILALPVPENDRMTQRYRQEAETLQRLIEIDQQLVGQAELLRELVDKQKGEWLVEHEGEVLGGVDAIAESLKQRQAILLS